MRLKTFGVNTPKSRIRVMRRDLPIVWEKSNKMAHVICIAALKAKALGLKRTPESR